MNDESDIARVAALLAEPARARMLWFLMDGTTRPAGELAFVANISAQSASAHLAKLVAGGLLISEAQGRHRYFRIASPEAAHMIESMASFSASAEARMPRRPALVRAMPSQFLHARTCYDHLAGEAAVQIVEAMLKAGWMIASGQNFILTLLGERQLTAYGVDLQTVRAGRRAFARSCVDLTQRRPHLSGSLGAALLNLFVQKGWIQRLPKSRIVHVTPSGQAAFSSFCSEADLAA